MSHPLLSQMRDTVTGEHLNTLRSGVNKEDGQLVAVTFDRRRIHAAFTNNIMKRWVVATEDAE